MIHLQKTFPYKDASTETARDEFLIIKEVEITTVFGSNTLGEEVSLLSRSLITVSDIS